MGLWKDKDMEDANMEQNIQNDNSDEQIMLQSEVTTDEEAADTDKAEAIEVHGKAADDVKADEMEEHELRHAERRKRRIRNEILAYFTAVLIVAVVSAGTFKGVSAFRNYLDDKKTSEESVATESTESGPDIQDIVESMLASETELPTEVEVVEEVDPRELFDEYLDTLISEMTLEEKVYGLIITSPEELTGVSKATRGGDGTKKSLEEKPVGGLVYYRKNMESEAQFTEMLTNTAGFSKYPLFLAVNEGGDSASSVQNSPIVVPDVTKPGAIGTAEEAKNLGSTIGGYLSKLHFNVNLAPTADILYDGNAAVKNYCFGGDATLNAQLVSAFVTGLKEQGIHSALKTFPGTGHLSGSTEDGSVNTSKTKADYEADFSVFKAGIEAGADFVMVSHIVAGELSGGIEPCSMSSTVVTDILRGELGFKGVIITEPMTNKAITEYYTSDEAAVAALKAGCDMILLPEDLEAAATGILDGVAGGTVSEARINDSLKRVFRVKYAEKLQEFAADNNTSE